MKVTVKFDEAAGMTPAQVAVKQVRDQQFAECERARRKLGRSCLAAESSDAQQAFFLALAEVWPNGGGR